MQSLVESPKKIASAVPLLSVNYKHFTEINWRGSQGVAFSFWEDMSDC